MRVWIDILSNDEMIADSYPYEITMEESCLEVKGKYTTKFDENIQIASDEDAGDAGAGVTIVDVVDGMKLIETTPTKKDFMLIVKEFLKVMVEKLTATKPDRVPIFKKNATLMIKHIVGKFEEMQFFTGPSGDMEASLAIMFVKDGESEPTIWFFLDALRDEKF